MNCPIIELAFDGELRFRSGRTHPFKESFACCESIREGQTVLLPDRANVQADLVKNLFVEGTQGALQAVKLRSGATRV